IVQGASGSNPGMHQIFHDLVLPVNIDRFAVRELGERNVVAPTAEAQIDTVVAHSVAMETVSYTHLSQQIRGELFQHSRANTIDDVIVIAAFEDYRIDPLEVQ